MEKKQSLNWAAIAVMYLLFFMIAFVTNFAGSMGVILKGQFNVSGALTQLGSLANFIAYACMGIPAGWILRAKGYKFTSLTAATVGFVGVGIQWLSGYASPESAFGIYVLGAFIAGISMCLLNIVVNPMLNTLGGGGNRGNQLIQFGGACNSIGGTIAPVLLGYLIGGEVAKATVADAAPALLIAMGIFALAFLIIFVSKIPEPHIETAEQKAARLASKDQYSPMSFRHFVLGAVAIFLYVGIEVGIPNMANLYMANNPAVGAAVAGTIVGMYWFSMLIGRLIGGALGGKISSKVMLSCVASMAIVLLLCTILFPAEWVITFNGAQLPVSMVMMVLCGLCTSVMWGSIFNLSAEGLGKYTPAASGIFMAMVCGGGIIPFVQGWIADLFNAGINGYLYSYVVLIICLAYIIFYALVGSKNVNKDIPTE